MGRFLVLRGHVPSFLILEMAYSTQESLKSVFMRLCLLGLTPSLPYSLGFAYLHPSWGINLFWDSRRENLFILFLCFCPALTKSSAGVWRKWYSTNASGDERKEVAACHAGDTNPRGINSEHAENKGMVFHVLLAFLMCCRHLLSLCSLWHNSEHWYRCRSS